MQFFLKSFLQCNVLVLEHCMDSCPVCLMLDLQLRQLSKQFYKIFLINFFDEIKQNELILQALLEILGSKKLFTAIKSNKKQ